jgi:hypothetical protein
MEAAAKAAGAAAIVQDDATETAVSRSGPRQGGVQRTAPDTMSSAGQRRSGLVRRPGHQGGAGGVQPFDEVKDKLRERLVTERALALVYDEANKIDGILGNGTALDALPPIKGWPRPRSPWTSTATRRTEAGRDSRRARNPHRDRGRRVPGAKGRSAAFDRGANPIDRRFRLLRADRGGHHTRRSRSRSKRCGMR